MIALEPVFLTRPDLDQFYGAGVVAADILKLGLLKPFSVGHKLSLFDKHDALVAAAKYRDLIQAAGGRDEFWRNREGF